MSWRRSEAAAPRVGRRLLDLRQDRRQPGGQPPRRPLPARKYDDSGERFGAEPCTAGTECRSWSTLTPRLAINIDHQPTGARSDRDRVRRHGARTLQLPSTNGATGHIRIAPTFERIPRSSYDETWRRL